MRILITNDDGILAPGIATLASWAKKLGQVVVVAPKTEQSGKSQAIELKNAFEAVRSDVIPGIEGYAVDSTPADCVRFAILSLKYEFDLVLSGINCGFNLGSDIVYSGTVGAAFEAEYFNINAVAVSGPSDRQLTYAELEEAYRIFVEKDLFTKNKIYNVNIPSGASGFRFTRQGGRFYSNFYRKTDENKYLPHGYKVYEKGNDLNIDTDAVYANCISITPLTSNRASEKVLNELNK